MDAEMELTGAGVISRDAEGTEHATTEPAELSATTLATGDDPSLDTGLEADEFKSLPQVKTITVSPFTTSAPSPVFTHTNATVTTRLEPVTVSCNRESRSLTASDEPVCRICHDTEDERGVKKLVSPCGCTGSAEFTHKKCLRKWTNLKGTTECEICKQSYKPEYIRFRQKFMTSQVMCMGSAASLPLLVIIIVGFFLLGEHLSVGKYDQDLVEDVEDDDETTNTSKIMVSVCMIATATFGIFLLCCFSVWAARTQPHQIENIDGGLFRRGEHDVERGNNVGRQNNNYSQHRTPVPLFFF